MLLQNHDAGLIALALVSGLAAVSYLAMLAQPVSFLRTGAKTLSVGLLAVIAILSGGPMLLVAALVLSALGDVFLAHEGDAAFLGGLGSFLAAHIAYAVLFFSLGDGFTAATMSGLLAVAGFALVAGFIMVRNAGSLALPVAAYVLAIASVGAGGVTLGGLTLLGVMLFMASDAVLGAEKFLIPSAHSIRKFTGPLVWVLYYVAQALITHGLLA